MRNLLSTTTPQPDPSTPASTTNFTYNPNGTLSTVQDPLGNTSSIPYYPSGLIQSVTDAQNNTTTYAYDARGNRTSVTDANQNQNTFTYDVMNRLTQITYPTSPASTVQFGYDYRGRRTSVTDQNGKTTTYAYDDADRLSSVTDAQTPTAGVTQYAYDGEDNVTSITDALGRQTRFTYDNGGQVTQVTFPSNLSESYLNSGGDVIQKTDRKNQTIQYVYDALDRLTSKIYSDTKGANYVYDLVGKIRQVTDPTGTYGFAYDNMGRLIGTTTQYSFLPGYTYPNSYTYDAASNRRTLTAPDGSTNTYNYDTLNRLSSLTNSLTGQFTFGYDGLSRRTSLTRPNGVNTSYSYDSVSRLLNVLHQAAGSTIDGASYTYDNAGNRLTKTNYLNGITEGYGYDLIYQLTQVTQGASTTESYTYDAVGNRLSSLSVPMYNYNLSNELTSSSAGNYTYDANGNTLADASGRSFTWDYENRLTQAVNPGVGTTTFRYDAFGRRIQKSGPLGTTNYLYDGMNPLEEVDSSGNVLARYTQGSEFDEEISELRSGVASYYEADGLGSVTSLSSSTGTLANTYSYDSFGNLSTSSGAIINAFQFTGREFDSETGLDFYRARYYNPPLGRFISEDPLGAEVKPNYYPYVDNNPVGQIDPLGLCPCTTPSTWTEAEELAYQAYVRSLQGTSTLLSRLAGIAVIGGYLLDPSSENNAAWANSAEYQFEKKCRRKGKWHCIAKCHINNFSDRPNIPPFVFGEGWGSSKPEAELAAEKDANENISRLGRGIYKRHCGFKCDQR